MNRQALIQLVREAMGSGVIKFVDQIADGRIDASTRDWDAVFGDFPAQFVEIRTDLVEALDDRSSSTGEDT